MMKKYIFATVCFSLLVCTDLCAQEKVQEEIENENKNEVRHDIAKVLGIEEAPYVRVYGKDLTQRSNPTSVYNAELKTLGSRTYLMGTNTKENHSVTYMYLLSEIRLMTFPNDDYKGQEEEEHPRIALGEMSLVDQVIRLRSDVRTLRGERENLSNVISLKNSMMSRLLKKIDKTSDQDLSRMLDEEKDALAEEIRVFKKTLVEMESEIAESNLTYVKKRRDAVVEGVYDPFMEEQPNTRERIMGYPSSR